MRDLHSNVKMAYLFQPADDPGATGECTDLVDITGYNGVATVYAVWAEDDSQDGSLVIAVHNVASDSEACAAGNLIDSITFTGQNDTGVDPQAEQLAINLEALTSTKPYLQVKITNASTLLGPLVVVIALDLARQNPVN